MAMAGRKAPQGRGIACAELAQSGHIPLCPLSCDPPAEQEVLRGQGMWDLVGISEGPGGTGCLVGGCWVCRAAVCQCEFPLRLEVPGKVLLLCKSFCRFPKSS